jgi:hypothetical protein
MVSIHNPVLDEVDVFAYMPNVTAESAAYAPAVKFGEIIRLKAARYGALAGTDTTITAKINGVAISGGTITMETTGDAAGDTDEVDIITSPNNPTNYVEENDTISFHSDGASDDATTPCMFMATIRNRRA